MELRAGITSVRAPFHFWRFHFWRFRFHFRAIGLILAVSTRRAKGRRLIARQLIDPIVFGVA